MTTEKTNRLTIRMTDEDRRRLEELAAHARRGVADYLRILINDEYDDLVGNDVG